MTQPASAPRAVEIAITGGPCAGKSTALTYLTDHLTQRGWRVLVVPEAATLLISGGLSDIGHLAANERPTYLTVQRHLTRLQSALRQQYLDLAAALGAPKTVLLYDRAEPDNSAYMNDSEFATVLNDAIAMTREQVAARYDAVLHLTTAADGALPHYSLANNAARSETPEQAIAVDRALQQAWLGHAHYTVIDNNGRGFDDKLRRTLAAVLNILGEPEPVEMERKWLLLGPPPAELLSGAVPVIIEQQYLVNPAEGTERRIRARTHGTHTTYWHTIKVHRADGHRTEYETQITGEEYQYLSYDRDPAKAIIRKKRHCFVHAGQHFELDAITRPRRLWLLEAELVTADQPVTLPDGLPLIVEVTGDPAWSNAVLATTAHS